MKHSRLVLAAGALLAFATSHGAPAADPAFDAQLLSIQQAWAKVNYETPAGDAREQAFEGAGEARRAVHAAAPDPCRGPDLGGAFIESSYAGAKGGLGALSLARRRAAPSRRRSRSTPARSTARPIRASARCTTGCRASRSAFGDHDKAAKLLKKALEMNPNGIDPNYFYADLLFEQKSTARPSSTGAGREGARRARAAKPPTRDATPRSTPSRRRSRRR